jgi:3',5'-cyclic AMP phosphodiesterase CpdA
MRILVASDLHLESTGAEHIRRLVAGMEREEPEMVILGGDLGNPPHLFRECLRLFSLLRCPVAVLAGNHDVWSKNGFSSERLFQIVLPGMVRECGYHWLEEGPVVAGSVAVAGSIGWYDYSASDPEFRLSTEQIRHAKPRYAADAMYVNWHYSDEQFADECRERLKAQLAQLEANPAVREVLVVTHMPVFPEQIDQRPEDPEWRRGNAYFAHYTLGERIKRFAKVRYVVSGHTHVGLNGVVERPGMDPIATAVVPSDYGRPRWITLDIAGP